MIGSSKWAGAAAAACIAAISLTGCDRAAAGGGATRIEATPSAAHEDGASVRVTAVERGEGRTVLEMVVVNGSTREIRVADDNRPMTLLDSEGGQHTTAEERIEVPAGARSELRLEFDGEVAGEMATLQINEGLRSSNTPALTIRDIPVAGGRTELAGPLPPRLTVQDLQAQHPNGTSISLGQVDFLEDEILVSFQAVNGYTGDIRLSGRSGNRAHLRDDTGRRYYAILPEENSDLTVPSQDRASGILRFAGRVGDSAERLTLYLNGASGGDSQYSGSPAIRVGEIVIEREAIDE